MISIGNNNNGLVRPTRVQRDKLVEDMKAFHAPIFKQMGVVDAHFYPKVLFPWKGGKYVSMYENELTAPNFFTELVKEDYSPMTGERNLYKWRGNKNFKEEYYKADGISDRYFVPIEELEKISIADMVPTTTSINLELESVPFQFEEIEVEGIDAPMSKMTMRDHCAIQWQKPVSTKKWLNDLIKEMKDQAKKNKIKD